LASPRGFEPL